MRYPACHRKCGFNERYKDQGEKCVYIYIYIYIYYEVRPIGCIMGMKDDNKLFQFNMR
jgi:hypothetical protein